MLVFYRDNDNLIRWDGMNRASDNVYVNDAVTTYELKDSDEVLVASGNLTYVAGSNGRYQGVVDASVDLGAVNDVVWLEASAATPGGLEGFRRIQGRVVNRKEN